MSKLGTGSKVAIWIGVLATVGVSGWVLHRYVYKPWKAKKDAEKNNQDFGAGINDIVIPTNNGTVTLNSADNEKSFAELKKYFANTTVPYTDRVEKIITVGDIQYLFQFFTNGRFFVFDRTGTSGSWGGADMSGNYSKGGRYLVVTKGAKKGRVAESGDVVTNLKSLL